MSLYNLHMEGETKSAQICTNVSPNDLLEALPEEYMHKPPPSLHLLSSHPTLQVFPPVTQSRSYTSVEGSSSSSNPSNECPMFDSNCGPPFKQSKKSSGSKNPECNKKWQNQEKECDVVIQNHTAEVVQKKENEKFHSKNLVTERNRRNRIKDGLFTLRSLVPKITKVGENKKVKNKIVFVCVLLSLF